MTTGDTKRDHIDPDVLGTTTVVEASKQFIDSVLDFIARYVRKVHSDSFIRFAMKSNPGDGFLNIIGPNDIAYVLAVFKNGQQMWNQDIRMQAGGNPEKKEKPLFSTGDGKKRQVGKSLWNKEGRKYFYDMENRWAEIYNNKKAMTILYKRWEDWIESNRGKEIKVGDGMKTFHYVMGTWHNDDETGELQDTNEDISESEDEGYSSERKISKYRKAWMSGELVMDNMDEKKDISDDDNSSTSTGGRKDTEISESETPRRNDKRKTTAAGIGDSPAGDTTSSKGGTQTKFKLQRGRGLVSDGMESPARNTRKAVKKGNR